MSYICIIVFYLYKNPIKKTSISHLILGTCYFGILSKIRYALSLSIFYLEVQNNILVQPDDDVMINCIYRLNVFMSLVLWLIVNPQFCFSPKDFKKYRNNSYILSVVYFDQQLSLLVQINNIALCHQVLQNSQCHFTSLIFKESKGTAKCLGRQFFTYE